MLDERLARKLTLADCQEYRESFEAELVLTDRRLERLKNTQAENPGWAAYDKYADDIVGIDIRIEEQATVREELENSLAVLSAREGIIAQAAMRTRQANDSAQLGLFDNAEG